MTFEEWLSGIIDGKSISVSKMAKKIGVPYRAIYNSFYGIRELRSSELIAICRYVGVNPMDYGGGDVDAKGCT